MKGIRPQRCKCVLIAAAFCFLSFVQATAQQQPTTRQITGRVSDAKGELLPGAVVTEMGTMRVATTDDNGTYTITTKSINPILKFNCYGYLEEIVEAGSRSIVDVSLEADVEFLDEIVLVGFGQQKKASVVGAISTIAPDLLQSSPSRSVSNNLAGKLGGVIAVQRSGNPWFNNSDFWIRGISTFAGQSNPLVLVDGIERSLHDMDPNEIETFSVLKDAAASAVYGVRGANGVIMITTKRGKIGTPKVTARVERSYTQPTRLPKYIGSVPYLELINEISHDANPDAAPRYSQAEINNYRYNTDPELYPDINWWDVVSRDYASSTTANVSVNGGSDVLRYALDLGLYNELGITQRDKSQEWDSSLKVRRYNVRSNVDINLTKTTLFRLNIGGYLTTRNAPPGWDESNFGIFYQASRIPPHVHPPVYASGELPRVEFRQNPWAWATQRGYETLNRHKIENLSSIEQDLKFLTPGLTAKLTFSFDRFAGSYIAREKDPDYYKVAPGRDANGDLILNIEKDGQQFLGYRPGSEWGEQSVYLEGSVHYDRVFADKHAVNAMFMYNQRELQLGHPDHLGDRLPYRTQGIAGRSSYTYDKRYIAEFNFGYNGSENFAKGKRFGFFPAFAAGWIISQEKFMKPTAKVISNMKIRGSWGKVGNSYLVRDIWENRFAYIPTIDNYGFYTYGEDSNVYRLGRAEGNPGSPDLTWETSTKTNLGLELGLWNNSIIYSVDLFRDNRENIFMPREVVPASAGFMKLPFANYGKVRNQGFEMSLNVNRMLTKDLYLSVLANYTFARNKITEKDEPAGVVGTHRARTGHPVNQIFGLIAERLFTEDDFEDVANGILKDGIAKQPYTSKLRPGDIKYLDLDGNGEVNDLDMTAIGGTFIPEIVYGFGANLRYKSVDFGFFFQGVANTYRIVGGENWMPGESLGATGNIFTNIDSRWTAENPSQDVFWPRLSYGANANNTRPSTWWLKDMSFLRLKSVEVGYSLPKAWVKKAGMEHFRLFVRGSNVCTFSKFKLWDPELDTTDGLKYPMTRSISFGININFL